MKIHWIGLCRIIKKTMRYVCQIALQSLSHAFENRTVAKASDLGTDAVEIKEHGCFHNTVSIPLQVGGPGPPENFISAM